MNARKQIQKKRNWHKRNVWQKRIIERCKEDMHDEKLRKRKFDIKYRKKVRLNLYRWDYSWGVEEGWFTEPVDIKLPPDFKPMANLITLLDRR